MCNIGKLSHDPDIEVTWDDDVKSYLKPEYQNQKRARVPVPILNLLLGLGCVQPKRMNPTLRTTLMDFNYLLDQIDDDNAVLKMRISETRNSLGSEMLTESSELLGIGLSVVVVSQLFDVQPSTISKIIGISSRRPDWRCLLSDGQKLQIEAKGSTNQSTSNTQLKKAVEQKRAIESDISIATATVLNEMTISKMTIKDPPVADNDSNSFLNRQLFRAYHYSSVFSFLGDDVLSLYFEKMAKRITGLISQDEMIDKELMFNDLIYNAPSIKITNNDYCGHLYGPIGIHYLFIGINKSLLKFQGFKNFTDDVGTRRIEKEGNDYIIYRDGIIIVNVRNATSFQNEYHIQSIGVSLDRIALTDLDSIRGNSFKRYVKYLLNKINYDVIWEENGVLTITENNKSIKYFIHHVPNSNQGKLTPSKRKKLLDFVNTKSGIIVTNLQLTEAQFIFPYIERSDFLRIADSSGDKEVIRSIFCRYFDNL